MRRAAICVKLILILGKGCIDMSEYKAASFFAGVGGIDIGFEKAGFETVYANEFDSYAADTFECNFEKIKVDRRDIHIVSTDEIPEFDILLAGFPCQAFSIAGYRQGFDDEKGRGELFFELIRIMEVKRPRIAFFENVKNLVGHDNGNTFKVIREQLDILGYKYVYQVMNACEYGNIPQNRERIYIVAFRDEEDFDNFTMPLSVPLERTIRDVIAFGVEQDEKYYYTEKKCNFYKDLVRDMKCSNTIYQWRRVYVRENKSNMVPTLTANMGTGGHNVPLILTDDGRIRKLTPRECFNVQGFPKDFILPEQSNGRLYKQAGNSVVVPVVERIAESIRIAIDKTDSNMHFKKVDELIQKGEERFAKLIVELNRFDRNGDIMKAAVDVTYRNVLFSEFGL